MVIEKQKNTCNLCSEISGEVAQECGPDYANLVAMNKNILFSSENFIVIPSVGPLNNTHVMLVPKKHVNNFAELSTAEIDEGLKILENLNLYVSKKLNHPLFFFESGAGSRVDHSGGCITHAHIHCVAYQADFFNKISEEVNLSAIKAGDYSSADKYLGYIWILNEKLEAYICNNPLLPSQFLRYLYSQCGKEPSSWNWRKNIRPLLIIEVIEIYKNFTMQKT